MTTRRSSFVYGTLLAIWIILIGWQAAEHVRVRRSARNALRHRAQDISSILALVMRSQHSFGPRDSGYLFVFKTRIETALNELVSQGEVQSVELLNVSNDVVAKAGLEIGPIDVPKGELPPNGYWDDKAQTVTLMNLADLGVTNILLDSFRPPPRSATNSVTTFDAANPSPPPKPAPGRSSGAEPGNSSPPLGPPEGMRGRRLPRLSEEEMQAMRSKQGVHAFLMVMSTHGLTSAINQDLSLRAMIGILAAIAVAGYGLAWRSLSKTSELQIRLVRVSELNSHLREMQIAAAGLAHETRNPLNIIRGMAQMLSKQPDASAEVRAKSRDIIDEADRVAAQLNEFINYSRPREVRRVAVNVNSIVAEVARALNYDIEEKKVQLQVQAEPLVIEADEQLLRQALFNLVLNAVQAVPVNGQITVRAGRGNGSGAFLEIADNGPGVAPEHRDEVFKPYFTTQEKGTGLGLAVVQQIVLAHGWEIACLPNQPGGALFRISHIKPLGRNL
jgi:signal transduction histidine kinase